MAMIENPPFAPSAKTKSALSTKDGAPNFLRELDSALQLVVATNAILVPG